MRGRVQERQTALTHPVLAYRVTGPGHHSSTLAGLRQLIVSNAKGRALWVVGGLRPGRPYRFTISAVTPAGTGPAATSPAVTVQP